MKFLADQDVFGATVRFLRDLGHDVVTASDKGMAKAADVELLETAHDEERIFVTRDRDYGALVFVDSQGSGVIYLRVLPSTLQAVHTELERVLGKYSELELSGAFLVVEPGRHRVRRRVP